MKIQTLILLTILASTSTFAESPRERDNRKLGVTWELDDKYWPKMSCVTVRVSSKAKHLGLVFRGINILSMTDGVGALYLALDTTKEGEKYYAEPCIDLQTLEKSYIQFMYAYEDSSSSIAHGVLNGKTIASKAKEFVEHTYGTSQ